MAVIGVDCGGTRVRAGLFATGAIEPAVVIDEPTPRSGDALASTIADMCERLGDARAVGLGVAGLVDHRTGDLVWMPHLGGGAPVAQRLSEVVGIPVTVDNDANAAAFAEASAGVGAGHRMVLMVTVGTGIGGGLVINGRIERGRAHLGEIGHIPFDRDGPGCSCGLRGCWETLASGTALDRAATQLVGTDPKGVVARLAGRDPVSGRVLVEAAAAGDPGATKALAEVASWFGIGLAALVAAFDPDVIVVGGGVSGAGEAFLGPARDAMAATLSGSPMRSPTPVVPARFGARAGMVGAAMAARNLDG